MTCMRAMHPAEGTASAIELVSGKKLWRGPVSASTSLHFHLLASFHKNFRDCVLIAAPYMVIFRSIQLSARSRTDGIHNAGHASFGRFADMLEPVTAKAPHWLCRKSSSSGNQALSSQPSKTALRIQMHSERRDQLRRDSREHSWRIPRAQGYGLTMAEATATSTGNSSTRHLVAAAD